MQACTGVWLSIPSARRRPCPLKPPRSPSEVRPRTLDRIVSAASGGARCGLFRRSYARLDVAWSVASRSQRVSLIVVSLIVIPFCLSVWMSVDHSATYSLPRLIDHNQIWSAGIYVSSDPCKPFWIPCLPYSGCQREKYAKFRLFPTRILATANVTHRAT